MKNFILIVFSLITFLSVGNLRADDKCYDFQLLGGGEKIANFGMDTTSHWWAITSPFDQRYRLYVDSIHTEVYDYISTPVFSADGNRWASFGATITGWWMIDETESANILCEQPVFIKYSPNSKVLAYSCRSGQRETITIGDREIRVHKRHEASGFYMNHDGSKYAFVREQSGSYVMNINGDEGTLFDRILPIGYWHDGTFLYAALNGINWEVYRDRDAITQTYSGISNVRINLKGDVAAFVGRHFSGQSSGVLINDEFYEPLEGEYYDGIWGMSLHPYLPIMAYNANRDLAQFVLMNNTEYFGGEYTGEPIFTHDGEDMYFIGCNAHCFCNISGQKFKIEGMLSYKEHYAMKPGSETICYRTSSSMVVRDLFSGELTAGRMVDAISTPRYNRKLDCYETLGLIRNRLYMLVCKI